MAELKPCPFCGRIPMVEDCGDNRYFVRCKCGIAQDKLYGQRCDAVRRWNTRKPSAQKKGHWKGERLKYPSGLITFIYRCSECGYEERHAYEDTKPSNYCPTCGAYMRGDTDEIIY